MFYVFCLTWVLGGASSVWPSCIFDRRMYSPDTAPSMWSGHWALWNLLVIKDMVLTLRVFLYMSGFSGGMNPYNICIWEVQSTAHEIDDRYLMDMTVSLLTTRWPYIWWIVILFRFLSTSAFTKIRIVRWAPGNLPSNLAQLPRKQRAANNATSFVVLGGFSSLGRLVGLIREIRRIYLCTFWWSYISKSCNDI